MNDCLPGTNEYPSSYADRLGLMYTSEVTSEHKKKLGQFFTPLSVAKFMASFCTIRKKRIKLLDPGCGLGILSCALIEFIVEKNAEVREIELVAFETDDNLSKYTTDSLEYLDVWLQSKKIKLTKFLCKNDFILHNSEVLNEGAISNERYDLIIANPPYFKFRKDDARTKAAKSIIYGQANIYTIFLIIAVKLLDIGGKLIFITPRSFSSGSYFKIFRERFFSLVDITNIHLFGSRKDAFGRDKILQENIIVVGKRKNEDTANQLQLSFSQGALDEIKISTSRGIADANISLGKNFRFSELVDLNSKQKIFHIPTSEKDEEAIKLFKTWSNTLKSYKMEISTGPVVDFRSTEFITNSFKKNCVPLIYLHNIEKWKFSWPSKKNVKGKSKGHYIINNEESSSRLLLNQDYIFLRRFSSKDDQSRLIATAYFSKYLEKYNMIGLENHINYIYRPKGILVKEEVLGVAALLNSKLFDLYFRTFNGNINVSATELRDLPLPKLKDIMEIGSKIINENKKNQEFIDSIIEEKFGIDLN